MRYALCATVCVALLGLSLPAAAGGWGGRYGVSSHHEDETSSTWSAHEEQGGCGPCARIESVSLPASFFEGDEGVGPFPDFPAWGGGGGFAAGGEAQASAFASARASASIRFHGHGGHHGGGGGGCGCGGKK